MKFDAAISFAGEDRQYAKGLANRLKMMGLKIFYDEWYEASMCGMDLYQKLDQIYRVDASYCIILISQYYKEKMWTLHELKSIQARAIIDETFFLPVVLVDVEIPGIRSTVGKLYANKYDINQIADMLYDRISCAANGIEEDDGLFEYISPNDLSPDIMTIISEDGSEEKVEVILAFEFKDNKNEYIIYTKNIKDEDGRVEVYVSLIDRTSGEPKLFGVEDDSEWERIKDIMWSLSKGLDEESNHRPPIRFDKNGVEVL